MAIIARAADRIIREIPASVYSNPVNVAGLFEVFGAEIDALRASLNDPEIGVLYQLYAATATSGGSDPNKSGLARFEQDLGLPIGLGLADDERRSRIIAKLRGYGTVTPDRVKAVADAFANGALDVVEDFPHSTVLLTFTSVYGVPTYVDAMLDAVRDVLPAHLALSVTYRYPFWNQFNDAGLRWDDVNALALTWDQFNSHGW